MACFFPRIASQAAPGSPLKFSGFGSGESFLRIPCGQCIGCREDHSRAWAFRCMAEAQTAGAARSFFVTPTYAPEYNPVTLVLRDHQLFLKRVRKHCGPVRFYMCGEYGDHPQPGDKFGRPHFHYLLFGLDIPDLKRHGGSSRAPIYTSETLTRLWGMGHVAIGTVTQESALYVAGYIKKRRHGKDAAQYYRDVDPRTGEVREYLPEFAKMSLKPGLGAEWFARYHGDVYPSDKAPLKGGKFVRPPPYFDTLYERLSESSPLLVPFDEVKAKRRARALVEADNATDARLKVRAVCAESRAKFFSNKKL